jgi:hypothetical protein
MKSLKYIGVLVFIIIASISGADAQKYFRIIDATSVPFSGGMQQSGSGITYSIKAVLLTSQKIKFGNIWIGKEYGIPESFSYSYNDGRTLAKGDTLMIRYTSHNYPPESPMAKLPKPEYKAPPIPVKGEALLGFTIGKTTRYRSIEKFIVQADPNRPK